MKKILALIMAMAMVLALAACGSSANNEVAEEPAAAEARYLFLSSTDMAKLVIFA